MRVSLDQKEGTRLPDGRVILKGAFHVKKEDKDIPIVIGYDFGNPTNIIGRATDFKSDEDGDVSFEMDFDWLPDGMTEEEFVEMCWKSTYATDVISVKTEKEHVIERARIRTINLIVQSPIPIPKEQADGDLQNTSGEDAGADSGREVSE